MFLSADQSGIQLLKASSNLGILGVPKIPKRSDQSAPGGGSFSSWWQRRLLSAEDVSGLLPTGFGKHGESKSATLIGWSVPNNRKPRPSLEMNYCPAKVRLTAQIPCTP